MSDLTMWLEATGALAGAGGGSYAKQRAPRVYWSTA
jgi:S-DNA-T family DNA segregation ATPase FtsK/SpoIIIE